MIFTRYSLLMAFLWSSLFIVLLVLFRKKTKVICKYGTVSMMLLIGGFVFRMIFPFEFPSVKVIEIRNGPYPVVDYLISKDIYGFSLLDVLSIIWLIVSTLLIIRLIYKHISFIRVMSKLSNNITPQIKRIQTQVEEELELTNVHIVCSKEFEFPMCAGLKKLILLPKRDYSDVELYYILKHEYTHFKNKDLLLKMLIEIFIALFWWNPFVYLLRHDLSNVLEINCDLAIVGEECNEVKTAYLQTIVNSIKSQPTKMPAHPRLTTAEFASSSECRSLKQRFKVVINYKPNKRRAALWLSCLVAVMLTTLSVSYMFVIQPAHDVPPEEIGEYEMTPENTYILETEDGEYIVVAEFHDHTHREVINEDFKNILTESGFEIINE